MKKRFSFLTLAVLLAFFTSCSFSNIEKESSLAIDLGSLRTTLSASYSDLSYCIVSIEPKAQNDIKIDFTKGESKASFKVPGSGTYKVMISGYNADNLKIAYGESDLVEVKPFSTTKATVKIHRLVEKPIPEGFVKVLGVNITGTETWAPPSDIFVSGRQFAISDLLVCDHEVTRGEYKAIMGTDPSGAAAYDKDGNELTGDAVLDNPVNTVSWYDAITYCNKLSIKEGLTPCYSVEGVTDWKNFAYSSVPTEDNDQWNAAICNIEADGYRLPTEAEWEYLAKGGEDYDFAGSNNASDVSWYRGTTNNTGTRTVKTKLPNAYGLYDMTGNVFEWCWDRASGYVQSGSNRIVRGGSWDLNTYAYVYRIDDWPNMRSEYEYQEYGFRVVRTINIRQKEDMIKVMGITIKGTETWTPASSVFVSGRQLTIPDLIACDHEVTRGEFVAVMGESLTQQLMDDLTEYLTNVYDKDGNTVTGDAQLDLPIGYVNWYHAMTYCNKLSLREGLIPCYSVEGVDDWGYLKFTDIPAYSNANLTEEEQNLVASWNAATCDFNANGYRLPTETEWEWLARGGNDHTEYAGSNTKSDVAWSQTGVYGPHLVKLLQPNGYGLYDMSGNLYEMCWDKEAYPITSTTSATGGESGFSRVLRGGCYNKECSIAPDPIYKGYSSDMNGDDEYVMDYTYGFRVVRTAD